jgi:hypothetical protein
MQHTIRNILEKLSLIEGDAKITPADVKSGLNAQQRSVPQMPAISTRTRHSPGPAAVSAGNWRISKGCS